MAKSGFDIISGDESIWDITDLFTLFVFSAYFGNQAAINEKISFWREVYFMAGVSQLVEKKSLRPVPAGCWYKTRDDQL